MFSPHSMSIKGKDLVLEIGHGTYPYLRPDCLADKFDNQSGVDISSFGPALFAAGKEFTADIPFTLCENEDQFFEALPERIIPMHKPSIGFAFTQRIERIKKRLSQRRDRSFLEGLMK